MVHIKENRKHDMLWNNLNLHWNNNSFLGIYTDEE